MCRQLFGCTVAVSVCGALLIFCFPLQAMKCCDVASGTKSIPLHKQWTARITDEFFDRTLLDVYLAADGACFGTRDGSC